jgi:hypothetical protein
MEKENLKFEYKSKMSGWAFYFILIPILVLFSLIGILLILFSIIQLLESGLNFVSFYLLCGGIFIFSLDALIYLNKKKETKIAIRKAYFDLHQKSFILESADGYKSSLPFSEIQSFHTRTVSKSSGDSSYTYHILYLQRKDGAWWDIQEYKTRQEADVFLNILKTEISLEESNQEVSNFESEPDILPRFKKEIINDATYFHWTEEISSGHAWVGFILVITFLIFFISLGLQLSEGAMFVKIVLTLFGFIFGSGITYAIMKRLFLPKDHHLKIGDVEIKYYLAKKGGKEKIQWSIPFTVPLKTQFSFDITNPDILNGYEILVLEHETALKFLDMKQKISSGDVIGAISDMIALAKKTKKLSFPGFPPGEILEFEKTLDATLRSFKVNVI